ncbi:MAG: hypothetical protein LBS97_07675 [Treponema sp.]|jgi:hypothetical protein|nr:hypothetical protein [Treponema sp.]
MKIVLIPVLLAALTFTGCVTVVEKAGRLLDGSAFAEKTLAQYRTGKKTGDSVTLVRRKDKSEALVITLETVPTLRFYATPPDADGNFFLTSYTFLAGNLNGWNEFTMDLSGSGTFSASGDGAVLTVHEPLEIAGISRGRIRRGSTRLTGDPALTSLRNRYERIAALTEWMRAQEGIPAFGTQKQFEVWWKERVLKTADLPEELRPLRDSGTLLIDWEEALPWIYLEYSWNDIVQSLYGRNNFFPS